MQKWFFPNKSEPYRPYDFIKYTGIASYSSEVVYPGIKAIDRSTYFDDEDARNYPIQKNALSCETWLRLRFKDKWEGYTAFKNVKLFVSADDPNITVKFGLSTGYSRPTVNLSTTAIIPQSACAYSVFNMTVGGTSGHTFGTSGDKFTDFIVVQAESKGTNQYYNGTPIYIIATYEPIGTNFTTDMTIIPSGFPISTNMTIE